MDILSVLPADTKISGCIGDDDSYVPFVTTAAKARENVAEVCKIHAQRYENYFAIGVARQPTTPASYWISDAEGFEAVMPDLPDVILKLATANGDVRSDWRVAGFEYRGRADMDNWDNDPEEWKAKADCLRKLADFLDKLAGA